MRAERQDRVLDGRRVLVAEDQYLIADDMRRAVVALGGEVIGPVAQVAAAEEIVREDRPDLALLDINLHGETIYDFAEQLRTANIPLIFATGYGLPDIRPGFTDAVRLEKPVTTEALAAAARSLGIGR